MRLDTKASWLHATSGQRVLVIGELNVDLGRAPCLSRGLFSDDWVDLEAASASAKRSLPDGCHL